MELLDRFRKNCILGAASVASRDGQTAFADMSAAYDALNQEAKGRIVNLNAYHSNLVGTTRVLLKQHESCLHALVGDTAEGGYYGLGMRTAAAAQNTSGDRASIIVLGRHSFDIPRMPLE